MKSLTSRPGRPINGNTPSPMSLSSEVATNGHRRTNSRHNPSKDASPVQSEPASSNRLVDLLVKASGKPVVATVTSGAKYQGLLLAVDVSSTARSALSVVLVKPVLVSKALINENSNSDLSLPDQLVIQSKDLIDIDFSLPREHEKPQDSQPQALESELSKATAEKPAQKLAEKPVAEKPVEKAAEKPAVKPASKAEVPAAAPVPEKLPGTTPAPAEKKGYKLSEILAAQPLKSGQFTHTQASSQVSAPARTQSSFKTDSDISSGFKARERELQRWMPDEGTAELTLEDNSNGGWDQFKVNEEKFGVESTYDEHLYTTRINTAADDYQERLKKAERLAREIEGLATTDRHVLEERGAQVDDSGMDEEDKYSGVIGDPVDKRGSELMAALRNASISNDLAATPPAPGKYATPRQRAAQYHNDPAIVMSSASRPVQSPPLDGPEQSGEGAEVQETASKPSSIPPKPQLAPHGESFRLNAKSEINALKEFSANFKVPHRMPNDLLPILAKDKIKQDEILRKLDPVKKPTLPLNENKKDVKLFKLNPKAAAFTPSGILSGQQSPIPPKASFSRSPNNPSPRLHNQRPYSAGSSGTSTVKRHHQISAPDFFGGPDKVPTAAGQVEKIKKVKEGFNLFATAKRKHKDDSTPIVLEKAFHTPPTWDSTVDDSYEKLLAQQVLPVSKTPNMMASPGMPYMASPLMTPGGGPQLGGYPGTPGGNGFSPHMQSQASLAAHYQQQQYQAALLYQQFLGGMPPGQPQMMYDQQFMPPGFIPGGFVSPGSPVGGNMAMGGNPYAGGVNSHGHQNNYNHHHQNRRYNNNHSQKPRGNQA